MTNYIIENHILMSKFSGDEGIWTPDLPVANRMFSQLNYIPMGLRGIAPLTFPLSAGCSKLTEL